MSRLFGWRLIVIILITAFIVAVSGSVVATATTFFYEDFSQDVFSNPAWSKTNSTVYTDTNAGNLHIAAAAGLDDWARLTKNISLPVTIESRMRLSSGGNNYRLPFIELIYGNSWVYDSIHVTYLSDYGWGFGNPYNQWHNDYTRGLTSENQWATLRMTIRQDGGTLEVKRDSDADFAIVAQNTWSLPLALSAIQLRQPWNAACDFDYLKITDGSQLSSNISINNIIPNQVIIDDVDIDGGNPDLVLGKKMKIMVELNLPNIPNFTGSKQEQLEISTIDQSTSQAQFIGLKKVIINYVNGVGTVLNSVHLYDRSTAKYINFITFDYLPAQSGNITFKGTLKDLSGNTLSIKETYPYTLKETRSFVVDFYPVDLFPSVNYADTAKLNNSFIKGLFPIADNSYNSNINDKIVLSIQGGDIPIPVIHALKTMIDLYKVGKLTNPFVDRVVGVVPQKWISLMTTLGIRNTRGIAFSAIPAVLIEEYPEIYNLAAHEIGHTFNMPRNVYPDVPWPLYRAVEEYGPIFNNDPRIYATSGYWGNEDLFIGWQPWTPNNFMYNDFGRLKFPSVWTNKQSYQYLFNEFKIYPQDPELMIVSGLIDNNNKLNLSNWYYLPSGTVARVPQGDFSISMLDKNEQEISMMPFAIELSDLPDGSSIGGFAFAVPYNPDTTKIVFRHDQDVLATIDPLEKLLTDAINSIPASGFKKNPGQRRKALLNKIDAVEEKIHKGEIEEAKEKLSNDIQKKIKKWLINNYTIDTSHLPPELTKIQVLEVVDNMLMRLDSQKISDNNKYQERPDKEED